MAEPLECRHFLDGRVTLFPGDCLEVLDRLPENSVDAIITDPPYHFDTIVERFGKDGAAPAGYGTDGVFSRASSGFMGKDWDGGDIAFRPETWVKALRVLKPGGHLAAFSAPKCVHKMAFGIETAGFEVRDRILHLFDLDVHVVAFLESLTRAQADALYRLLDHFGPLGEAFWTFGSGFPKNHDVSKAIDKLLGLKGEVLPTGLAVKRMIPGADQHRDGWLKNNGREYQPGDYRPASEPAQRWNGWGTALKPAYEPIVIARKPIAERSVARQVLKTATGGINIDGGRVGNEGGTATIRGEAKSQTIHAYGNGLGAQGGTIVDAGIGRFPANLAHDGNRSTIAPFPDDGCGSAARFFYTAKADAHDRIGSGHPTVKPLDLMQWLCRMLTPPGGTILDIFGGTGTTGEAAFREGFSAQLIERESEYQADIARRMENALAGPVARRHAATRAKMARRQSPVAPTPATGGATIDIFGDAAEGGSLMVAKSMAGSPTKATGGAD